MQNARAQFFHSGEVVGDHHHGQSGISSQINQQPQEAALTLGIHTRQWFIQDQRLWPSREQTCDHHTAHLAAAELVDAAAGQ